MAVDFVLAFSDRYLIAIFLTVGAVAAYQPAYQLASLVLFIPRFSAVLLVPHISKMFDSGNRLASERLMETFMKLFLMIAVPFTVGVLMLGSSIVALLTTPEIGAAGRWVPPLVAVGSIFYGLMLLMEPAFLALGRNRTSLAAYAAGAGVNLALNLILLPFFRNVHIAAISTLIGYAVGFLWMWTTLRADWRLRVSGLGLLRYLAAAAVMGSVVFALGYDPAGGHPIEILSLVGSIIIAVAVYFATLSALGGFGRTELTEIHGLLKFRAGRD
jgi:O-antigen/teichoic acid export membrane protein